jgi:PPK2 family polyphosphate:nucleotide phosphotransferase
MTIDSLRFKVTDGKKFRLRNYSTLTDLFYTNNISYKSKLKRNLNTMSEEQAKLYASGKFSLLVILQAMDAAGKDGTIKHVMSGVNPQGCRVESFKQPSALELSHEFLWRSTLRLPKKGEIVLFNRSYYEDVLVARVHPEILDVANLPDTKFGRSFWESRYKAIRDYEQHLHQNGTRIIKFFLYISKEEQRLRLLDRINNPEKNWKLSLGDFEERKYWDEYMNAFEKAIQNTSTPDAPWYCIPADDKKNARLLVSDAILRTLKDMQLSYPEPTLKHTNELEMLREKLEEV